MSSNWIGLILNASIIMMTMHNAQSATHLIGHYCTTSTSYDHNNTSFIHIWCVCGAFTIMHRIGFVHSSKYLPVAMPHMINKGTISDLLHELNQQRKSKERWFALDLLYIFGALIFLIPLYIAYEPYGIKVRRKCFSTRNSFFFIFLHKAAYIRSGIERAYSVSEYINIIFFQDRLQTCEECWRECEASMKKTNTINGALPKTCSCVRNMRNEHYKVFN